MNGMKWRCQSNSKACEKYVCDGLKDGVVILTATATDDRVSPIHREAGRYACHREGRRGPERRSKGKVGVIRLKQGSRSSNSDVGETCSLDTMRWTADEADILLRKDGRNKQMREIGNRLYIRAHPRLAVKTNREVQALAGERVNGG